MADDLDNKLKQIADMFGVSDTEGLKNIVNNIMPKQSNTNNTASPMSKHAANDHIENKPDATMQTDVNEELINASSGYQNSDNNSRTNSNYGTASYNTNHNSNADVMAKASEVMSMFSNVRDSRITLLNSVQPFLGAQRQQRLGGAIQLLKVINVISTISPTINGTTKG